MSSGEVGRNHFLPIMSLQACTTIMSATWVGASGVTGQFDLTFDVTPSVQTELYRKNPFSKKFDRSTLSKMNVGSALRDRL